VLLLLLPPPPPPPPPPCRVGRCCGDACNALAVMVQSRVAVFWRFEKGRQNSRERRRAVRGRKN